MTDPLHTEPVEVTQADVHAAALQWCGEKDRETSLDDVRYFENNWQSLPGLRSRVEAFARHRTAAEAASREEWPTALMEQSCCLGLIGKNVIIDCETRAEAEEVLDWLCGERTSRAILLERLGA